MTEPKTLLLCFIHGFKGGDDTFRHFPTDIRALLSHALPSITVVSVVYPKFETRGDLQENVGRFKEWLQNKVIDLEVANGTPSPTVDPSVRVILIGHSMGGIMAAEAVLSIARDKPINASEEEDESSFMFPYVQGVLAFDTPYVGISPGVVAHGAEGQWNAVSAAYSTYNSVSNAFGWKGQANNAKQGADATKMLPAPEAATALNDANVDAAAAPSWQRWGKVAMFAGAAGAVAAGGAAAWIKRDKFNEGLTWVGSHLEFVGCLARGKELEKRLSAVTKMGQTHGLGFANMYTVLGKAVEGQKSWAGNTLGEQRTFCVVPKGEARAYFVWAVNDVAKDEVTAHCTMFEPKNNPGYYALSQKAKEIILDWTQDEWFDPGNQIKAPEGAEDDVEIVEPEDAQDGAENPW